MPRSAPKLCARPGCGGLTRERFCEPHTTLHERERGSSHDRGYGAPWRRKREHILDRDPYCRMCHAAASCIVDHIVPQIEGGSDDDENLQGLCGPCNDLKTAADDARRGRLPHAHSPRVA
jgi:5-methylcytosine-specific restriction protein A